ncbi:hypothetical protein [Mesomycoplasma ovipneumoniae]|uniref:hypothetical protein n=1 Tax=Mesomycoplasma ovipneumoniae TaxID=29562 RepID=UPI0026E26D02|nr:hypothetical protein [Mesomycoplasma ovipneumoniae]MDO6829456.1 hypothetical protein [Mesomycoplasma ovipneumoniae]
MNIVKLEIQNLSNEEKETLYSDLMYKYPQRIKDGQEWSGYGTDYQELNNVLEYYFRDYPDMFIRFQATYSKSLYNQTIKENNFAHLSFEDVVNGLTFNQQQLVILNLLSSKFYVQGREYPVAFLERIDKKYIFEFEKLPKSEQVKMPIPYQKLYFGEELERYNQNRFVLIEIHFVLLKSTPKSLEKLGLTHQHFLNYLYEQYLSKTKNKKTFFKNERELLLFALNDLRFAPELLRKNKEYLNPHYKVNQWIVKNHELELIKKDIPHLKCKDQKKCKH